MTIGITEGVTGINPELFSFIVDEDRLHDTECTFEAPSNKTLAYAAIACSVIERFVLPPERSTNDETLKNGWMRSIDFTFIDKLNNKQTNDTIERDYT